MSIVSKHIYKKVANRALQEGLSPDLLAHHTALLSEHAAKPFVSFALLLDVYELAHQHLTPGFVIRVGMHMIPEDYGTLGLSWKTSWRARDIFERTARYSVLITDRGDMQVTDSGDSTHITVNRAVHRMGQARSNEATFAVGVNMMRMVTQHDISPTRVTFIHRAPEDITNYTDFFNCDVRFSQKTNTLSFLNKDLDIPTITADKGISKFLIERMEEEKEGMEQQADQLVVDISTLIKNALPSGIPSMQDVSKHLGMSSRTLTRRLVKSNITFRQLIKNAQEEIAKYLLYSSNQSISEIAFLTGFSEQSAFNRAFKKWTDQTPMEYRKNS